jgi:methylmalonyl-CoA epimerase
LTVRPPFPGLHVDHVSIAVRAIAPALAFLRRILPIEMRVDPRPGYDGDFTWTDFFVGDFKLELIESARPGSFVERFIARRGEGMHHLSIDVEEDALDRYAADLERAGLRIVDRGDYGNGDKTAFISPRTAPGILVQFWQVPGYHGGPPPDQPTSPVAERDGVRFRVDHVSLAVRSIDATLDWFRRTFPVEVSRAKHAGWDGTHNLLGFRLAGYKMELLEPAAGDGGFVARFLARRGEGFHHLAIDVDRLDRLAERLEADGLRLVDRADLPGGRKTAFLHPRDAHGVLVQFWQEPEFGAARRV